MAVSRVTQNMISQRSVDRMQTALQRLARTQEQLSTGRRINRASDAPSDASAAMRMRARMRDQEQFTRNGADALGWLAQTDTALANVTTQLQRAQELAVQAGNGAFGSQSARDAIANELEGIRAGLIDSANTAYVDRPVFGGITAGNRAYDSSGAYVGADGPVTRTVAQGVRVQVNLSAAEVFGPPGASVFDDLQATADAIRAGTADAGSTGLSVLRAALDRVVGARTEAGTRYSEVERAQTTVGDYALRLRAQLSELEDVDLAEATMDVSTQEVAYQAALGAAARVMQPSLLDFLR